MPGRIRAYGVFILFFLYEELGYERPPGDTPSGDAP
jgi:hypothetical protein